MLTLLARAAFVAACLASFSPAQNLNVDAGGAAVPSPGYGGAASVSGFWNAVRTPYSAPLLDVGGAATGATCSSMGAGSFLWPSGPLTGDDAALMTDGQTVPPFSGGDWFFQGLIPATYRVYTYGWAPDDPTKRTWIYVPGSPELEQMVGGAWNGGAHVPGVTYALHRVRVHGNLIVQVGPGSNGGTLTAGSTNGFQLVLDDGCPCSAPFCVGDGLPGSVPCPCANVGAPGAGCQNSAGTGGAKLMITGSTSPDLITLTASGTPPTSTCVVLQGTSVPAVPQPFGDGVLCIGGTLKRLYVTSAVAGTVHAPPIGFDNVSTRSASLGDPILPGSQRHYQVYYRDTSPTYCVASATWNVSPAISITW